MGAHQVFCDLVAYEDDELSVRETQLESARLKER